MKILVILTCVLLYDSSLLAQTGFDYSKYITEYDYSKKGSLIIEPYHQYDVLKKTHPGMATAHLDLVKRFIDGLTASSPILAEKKGFDLGVSINGFGNMDEPGVWKHKDYEYGLQSEICFSFELFFKKGGKWENYCPQWLIKLNAPMYNASLVYQSLHSNIKLLNEVFLGYSNVKEIAPGIRFHYNDNQKGELVFYNLQRPDYWLPVTVKEIVSATLKYYSEKEKGVYPIIKSLADALSEEELNAPAYYGGLEADGLLGLNGRKVGVPFLRFNSAYWDKALPRSAIQFFAMKYTESVNETERDRFCKNNGRIDYKTEVPPSIDIIRLSELIKKQ
jgi:hypothetical protein